VPGPLDGVTVIDLTTVFSGPYATVLLGDLGADVIKIEAPGGEVVRNIGPSPTSDMGPLFLTVDRNKRDVCLDLKQAAAREVLHRLVEGADVLVHNMRPGAAKRIGADPGTTRARNARLVHCAISGFGSGGPYEDLPAYDDVVQAASGIVPLQSQGGGPAQYLRTVAADKTAGMMAFGAVCAALVQRDRTGEGCAVEVPMFELFASFVMLEHLYGAVYVPPTAGTGYPRVTAPDRRPYETADGLLGVVFYVDRHWQAFFDAIGRPELMEDERFSTMRARTVHSDELYALVGEIMPTRSTADWLELLRSIEVPAMPVQSIDDLLVDPHLAAVGFFQPATHPSQGDYLHVRNPVRFSTGIDDLRVAPPRLGEHTLVVLADLGYAADTVAKLLADGAAIAAD
jgi:crotonobetainyl-CoA:carnitine CoA-transferase CaiB-like acyl-CoA transferase